MEPAALEDHAGAAKAVALLRHLLLEDEAPLALGAIVGDAGAETIAALDLAGRQMGLALQIQDDLLNTQSTLRTLGKRAGTDAARGKATFPAAVGKSRAQREVATLLKRARGTITRRCANHEGLLRLIDALTKRER